MSEQQHISDKPLDSDWPTAETEEPAAIMRIQEELARLRLFRGSANGHKSPETADAIARYQEIHWIPKDGKPSEAILNHQLIKKLPESILIDDALQLMREAVRGNGMKPENVTLVGFDGEVLDFEVFECFKVESKTAEKQAHGRQHGEVVGSQQDARNKIQASIEKVTLDTGVKKNTVDFLKKRADLGFAVENMVVNLDRLRKTFVVHESCTTCSSTGKGKCPHCQGAGKVRCIKCRGTKERVCPTCHGRNMIDTPQGRKQCPKCFGKGEVGCQLCKRTGWIACPQCKRTGTAPCTHCSGTGWHSHMYYLEVRAKSYFYYDKEKLPPEVTALIDALGGEMVTGGHAHVEINEDMVREQELNQTSKPDEFIIPYRVRLPWGSIGFLLRDQPLEGKLFGYQPSLVHMPPFLEELTMRWLKALAEAARAQGSAAGKMQEAAGCRLVSDAMVNAARYNPQKASQSMLKRYPFGVRAEVLQKTVLQCDQAIKRATQAPRATGLAIGLALAAALFGAYYLGPGRGLAQANLPDANLQLAADFVLLFAGGALATQASRLTALRALRRALGKIMTGETKKKLMPKAGAGALWAYGGGFLLWLGMLELSVRAGGEAPPWFAALRGLAGL